MQPSLRSLAFVFALLALGAPVRAGTLLEPKPIDRAFPELWCQLQTVFHFTPVTTCPVLVDFAVLDTVHVGGLSSLLELDDVLVQKASNLRLTPCTGNCSLQFCQQGTDDSVAYCYSNAAGSTPVLYEHFNGDPAADGWVLGPGVTADLGALMFAATDQTPPAPRDTSYARLVLQNLSPGTEYVMTLWWYAANYSCRRDTLMFVSVSQPTLLDPRYYRDADGDGYGTSAASVCLPQAGYVADSTDCDDTDPTVHPGAPDKTCNGIDNNCNHVVDEGNAGCICVEHAPGLAGWWRGNGTTADAAAGNDGIPFGGVTYSAGRVGQAFSLDGVDDYVANLGDAFSYAFIENTGIFTIEAWINLSDVTAHRQQSITASTGTSTEKGHFFIWENSAGEQKLRLGLMKSIDGVPVIESSSPNQVITTNGWHHVAAVGNGTSVTFYVDGTRYAGTGTMTSKPAGPSTRAPDIGRCPPALDCMFNGQIDELGIYDRALSASEIGAIYKSGANGMCGTGCTQSIPGLVGWWPGSGDGNDRSPYGNVADVAFVGFAPGRVGQAFSFNGSNNYVPVADASSLEVTSQLTLTAWIRPDAPSISDFAQIISKFGTSGNWAYQIGTAPSGKLRSDFSGQGTSYASLESPTGTLSAGVWHHVATTFDSGLWKLYVDGNVVASLTLAQTTIWSQGGSPLNLGRDPIGIQYFAGVIDEPMVFNRALGADQIRAIYNAGTSGMCGLGLVLDVAEPPPSAPAGLAFAPPWPNPSARRVNVRFQLAAAARVRAEVFDVAGREVASLIDGQWLPAGDHAVTWDGRDASGLRVRAGIYQVRVVADGASAARRVVLIER